MLKVIIESRRHDEPVVTWISDMFKFKSVKFKKHVIAIPNKHERTHYVTTIEKVEHDDAG